MNKAILFTFVKSKSIAIKMENTTPVINQNIIKSTYSGSEVESQILMENFTEYISIKNEKNLFIEKNLNEYTDKSTSSRKKDTIFSLEEKF
jgi:hypothetical protein